uniref:MAM domain-containing protein n=1 Tax=Ditylenchus dipsaci TaxID=166011 RepID=A0A915EFZ9_9BILA
MQTYWSTFLPTLFDLNQFLWPVGPKRSKKGICTFLHGRLLLIVVLQLVVVCHACIGSARVTNLPGRQSAALRNKNAKVLAAPNLDRDMRAAKCQRADFGIYRADELRALASVYEYISNQGRSPAMNKAIMKGGKHLNCHFDSEMEACGWYSMPMNTADTFQKGRFESFFELEKFDCTSDRSFPFDDYFLIFGGREVPKTPSSSQLENEEESAAALEAFIPCQVDKAVLKFDYWSNNETPTLKICVLPQGNPTPQCEESLENVGKQDIVFIDNIQYEGRICHLDNTLSPSIDIPQVTDSLGAAVGPDEDVDIPVESVASHLPSMKVPFLQLTHSPSPEISIESMAGDDQEETSSAIPPSPTQRDHQAPSSTARQTAVSSQQSRQHTKISEFNDKLIVSNKDSSSERNVSQSREACHALTCDFNYGDSCAYTLAGLGSTAEWRLGTSAMGNPHTGIHRPNPYDAKMTGFAFVGLDGSDFSGEVFVLESARFVLPGKQPIYLVFDLFQRSLGPQLKVCINSFDNCPYSNPRLDASHYWLVNQRVLLNPNYARKVYFIAGKVRQNLFVAIDNIRLQRLDTSDYCSVSSELVQQLEENNNYEDDTQQKLL